MLRFALHCLMESTMDNDAMRAIGELMETKKEAEIKAYNAKMKILDILIQTNAHEFFSVNWGKLEKTFRN